MHMCTYSFFLAQPFLPAWIESYHSLAIHVCFGFMLLERIYISSSQAYIYNIAMARVSSTLAYVRNMRIFIQFGVRVSVCATCFVLLYSFFLISCLYIYTHMYVKYICVYIYTYICIHAYIICIFIIVFIYLIYYVPVIIIIIVNTNIWYIYSDTLVLVLSSCKNQRKSQSGGDTLADGECTKCRVLQKWT